MSSRRWSRVGALLVRLLVLVVALGAFAGCDAGQVNAWRASRGLPPLSPEDAQKVAAAIDAELARRARFVGEVHSVDAARLGSSWQPHCPVAPADLRLLRLSFVDFEGAEQVGELVVHRSAALGAVAAFRRLYDSRFPIRRMRTIDAYGGDDDASMADDNTSGFNCRFVAGTSRWSEHAYGVAIDVNPVENPWVRGAAVDPPAGVVHLDRTAPGPGRILAGDATVRAFEDYGFRWGGYWSDTKDYQHFSTTGR